MKVLFIALFFQIWANEIPKREFHEPTEEDKKKVQEIVDAYEINSLNLGRHSSKLVVESGSKLELSHWLQVHCEDTKGNEKWWVTQQVTADLRSDKEAVPDMVTERAYRVLFRKDHAFFSCWL